jgi:hypothetical protein
VLSNRAKRGAPAPFPHTVRDLGRPERRPFCSWFNHPAGTVVWPTFRRTGGAANLAHVYLLRYKRDGSWRFVVIASAYSVAHARMIAAALEPGTFIDGHRVSRASVARLPTWAMGAVLTLADLTALVEGKKKPPAPLVRPPHGDAL